MSVSVEELRKRLDYDPETGVLRWRKGCRIAGTIKRTGYREIWFLSGGVRHYLRAHRVAWALQVGAWPPDEIDHRDGNRDNNRLANLRSATRGENAQNLVLRPRRHAPMVGASKTPEGRWRSWMNRRYLGTFGSAEEAHQAYLVAKKKFHPFQPIPREG
jgi:HNH endonuclease